jgi:cell division septation protein DedD
MQRIFALDEPHFREAPQVFVADHAPDDAPEDEFELVVGRRQLAAMAFLALVVVAVCSGSSYLAGKVMSSQAIPAREESIQPVIKLEEASTPLPALPAAPMIQATIVRAPVAPAAKPVAETPLFASPVPRAIYIQVGAVEKGVAIVIAEGLRQHALSAFVARGPDDKVFRVLIGPFPDAEGYQKAQRVVDQIGLASFARRYQSQ